MMQRAPSEPTQAVDRAIALLRAVADAPAPPTALELGERCGLSRSTAWRLLQALERHGFVRRDAGRRYLVGPEVARIAAAGDGEEHLRAAARPTLEALMRETGATINLNVLAAGGIVSIDQTSPPTVLAVDWVGVVAPLHATPSGKVALAGMREDERRRRLPRRLEACASRTITDPAALAAELEVVAARGWASIEDEFEDGLNGVAVAVHDRTGTPVAYVTAWAAAPRMPAAAFGGVAERLLRAAADLSARL